MPNDLIAGIFYPDTGADANVPGDMEQAAETTAIVSVPYFATKSARDGVLPSPTVADSPKAVLCGDSGLWFLAADDLWRAVGPRIVSTTTTASAYTNSSGSATSVAQLNVAFTSIQRRIYSAHVLGTFSSTVGGDLYRFVLNINGNVITFQDQIQTAGGPGTHIRPMPSPKFILDAGTWTPAATLNRQSGSGTVTMSAGAVMVIVDEGPA